MGIRLVVVDDNPHVTWEGRVHPVNATFQQFVAGLLDVPGLAGRLDHLVRAAPRRDGAAGHPAPRPADPGRRHRPVRRDRRLPAPPARAAPAPTGRRCGSAIGEADLLWIKVPASNATLAATIARRAGMPRFVWVAGSAADVAGARFGGVARIGGAAVGLGYDAIGRLAGVGGHRLVVGEGLVEGDGIVASLVEPDELRDPGARPWPPAAGRWPRPPRLGRTARRRQGTRGAARGRGRRSDARARAPRRRAGPGAAGRARGVVGRRRSHPLVRPRRRSRDVPGPSGRRRRLRLPVAGGGLPQGRARRLRGRPAGPRDTGRRAR